MTWSSGSNLKLVATFPCKYCFAGKLLYKNKLTNTGAFMLNKNYKKNNCTRSQTGHSAAQQIILIGLTKTDTD